MALGCRWAALVRLAADGDGSGEVFGLGTPQGSGSPETSGIVGQLHVLSAAGGVLQGLPDGTPLVFLTDPDTADPGGERLQGVAVLDRKHRHPIVLCFGTSVLPGSRSRLEQDVLQLMPHLRQMLVLRDTAEQYRLMARMSIAIFNRAPNALIALAPDGTVAYLNEPARQLLAAADGMKLAGTRLSVHDAVAAEAIRGLLAGIQHEGGGTTAALNGRDLLAARPSGAQPYVVSLLPVVSTGDDAVLFPRRWLLAIVTDLAARRVPDQAYLQEVYGLSQAEARVCQKMSGGQGLEEVAAELNLSLATVKSHLLHIYRKFDVDSRVQLMQRLQCHVWTAMPIVVPLGPDGGRSRSPGAGLKPAPVQSRSTSPG